VRASTSAPVIPELKTRTIVTAVVPMYDEAALLAANLARLDSALAAASDRYDFTPAAATTSKCCGTSAT
jgi:hypothetical protein